MANNKFKTFSGNRKSVEHDFNKFLREFNGSFSHIMMTGTDDNLVIGIVYVDAVEGPYRFY